VVKHHGLARGYLLAFLFADAAAAERRYVGRTERMADLDDSVSCEVCGLPHRRGVAICEDCRHVLGRAPDWPAIRGRRSSYATQCGAALAVTVGMLWLNFVLFGGAGYIVAMAPVVWLVMSGYRYRVLSTCLARSTGALGNRH
jgi:hypothetical protein